MIAPVGEADLPDLLPLLRAYCDFYAVDPDDASLEAMCRALLADSEREGFQLIARADASPPAPAVGFATVFWSWNTLTASRIGVMNDLYVAPDARGRRLADALIAACRERCRAHGASHLVWQTAKDNHRAQAVYDRVGGVRSEWLDYALRA